MIRLVNIERMVRWRATVERVLLPSGAAWRCKSYNTFSSSASVQPQLQPSYPCSPTTIDDGAITSSSYYTHLPCSCHLRFQPKVEEQCDEDEQRWDTIIRNKTKNDVYYSLAEKKVLRPSNDVFYRKNRLQEDLRNTLFVGSSCGWNLLLRPEDCSLHLLNPFFPNPPVVPLPPIESLPHVLSSVRRRQDHHGGSSPSPFTMEFSLSTDSLPVSSDKLMSHGDPPLVRKFVLSSSPWTWNHPHQTPCASAATRGSGGGIWKNDCTAVIAGLGTLAFCRLGDEAWTALKGERELHTNYVGVAFCRYSQTLYAFTGSGIEAWDLSNHSSPRQIFVKCFYPASFLPRGRHRKWLMSKYKQHFYFVGLPTGGLLMAVKHILPYYHTIQFDLCELHFSAQKMKSKFVEDLGDYVLLLDSCHSALVSAKDFPELKPNSIYFVGDCGLDDMGLFSLNDGSIVPFFPPSYPMGIKHGATWVIPDPS